MSNIKEKIEASIMLASYLETVGFKNGIWEFNYEMAINDLPTYLVMWNIMMHHYIVLGGSNINIMGQSSSDDTIMIFATADAVIAGGGIENYKKYYLENYDLLTDNKRASGTCTIDSMKQLKRGLMPKMSENMGGNGAAMRTGPIGLRWYNDYEKVIEESIIASMLTHNYSLGFLGGMITALFTSFAMKKIPAHLWVDELLEIYKDKKIHKYFPKDHDIEDIDYYIGFWKRYKETRINKLKFKNSLKNFIFPEDRAEFLMGFYPNDKIKEMVNRGMSLKKFTWNWAKLGSSGLDSCIYAYDCLLMSMHTPNKDPKTLDLDNVEYNFETFMMLVTIHPGDNDTTAAIGGTWYGALCGYNGFNKEKLKNLEFYEELKKVSNKIIEK
jgi:ADP-ribosylarginine hydrolase